MSQKIKRKFLIAAKEPGWFRAVSENELARAGKEPEDALYFEKPLEGANLLSAHDKYNLLHIGVASSPGVKADLAAALASEIVKRPEEVAPLLASVTEAETEFRFLHFDYSAEVEPEPAYLKSLPLDKFDRPEMLARLVAVREAAENIEAVLKDASKRPPEKQQAVTAALMQLDGGSVIRFADSFGFHYGDAFNEWDGPTRAEVKAYFNVPKSLMQHWDEAGKSSSGKPYDAISAGREGHRVVFLTGELVEKKKSAATPAAPSAS